LHNSEQPAECGSGNTCLTPPYTGPWYPVVGAFEISFYALGDNTSTPTVEVQLQRAGGTNVSRTFALTNDGAWHQYSFSFTGGDTSASAQNLLMFTMTASNSSAQTGATIYVDDAHWGGRTRRRPASAMKWLRPFRQSIPER
jgi:hypothetical protein